MINIENILNTPVEKEPWEHLRVENILEEETYNVILNECLRLSEKLKQSPMNSNGYWPNELIKLGTNKNILDTILDVNKIILNNSQKILNKFSNSNKSNVGYYSVPRFGRMPKNTVEHIHDDIDDGDNKSLVMVIYLHPSKAPGTKFYSNESPDSFVKEIKWKQNTAMIFSPVKGVTWHNFQSGDEPRLSYNFYCEKIEESKIINDVNEEKFEWFYKELSNNKLMVEF